MRVLFVGNSHTYYNDMPYLFAELLRASGRAAEIAMLTRGGESLSGHAANEQTRFNILYGDYDWVILQQVSSGFPPLAEYLEALQILTAWCREAGSRCGLFMNFAAPTGTPPLAQMRTVVLAAAQRLSLPVARVGEAFAQAAALPGVELYDADRHHPSPAGSYLIALTMLRDLIGIDVRGLPAALASRGKTVLDLEPAVALALQDVVQAL